MMNFSSQARQDIQSLELRQALLERVQAENDHFTELMQQFHEQERRDDAGTLAICEEIQALVERVLSLDGWQESLFLRNLMKPLEQARDDANAMIAELRGESSEVDRVALAEVADDEVVLYMTLYQARGYDISTWNLQLRSIAHTMLGRPIYETENAAQTLIRAKLDQSCEAYVAVCVKKDRIMHDAGKGAQLDRHNNELIILEQGAITTANIREFIYMNKRYHFAKGTLSIQE